jgi:Chaperone of endosialidase
MKTTTRSLQCSINRTPCRFALLLIPLALACIALAPQARAVCQEGCDTSLNTFLGEDALINNTDGFRNIAIGSFALNGNTTGRYNTAVGFEALIRNTTGKYNTAVGVQALVNSTTGNSNIALGPLAGVSHQTDSLNIDIGSAGIAGESQTISIGVAGVHRKTAIAGIWGATVPTGVAVIVDANGHLGTTTSSARFKDAIKPMDKGSEAILALKPVTFRYKHELDPNGIPQFGLVAEDVEKVNPDLVAHDEEGKPYTVRYDAVNAMLLNEFLKEHRTVQAQQKEIEALRSELKEQKALIQEVSDKVELNKPVPETVSNND